MTSTTTPPARIIKDAELARAAAGGDRAALAGIYERYARPLHDYCVGLVRDHHDAADCVQDVFCTAVAALPKLRDPEGCGHGFTPSPVALRCAPCTNSGANPPSTSSPTAHPSPPARLR